MPVMASECVLVAKKGGMLEGQGAPKLDAANTALSRLPSFIIFTFIIDPI